jgi:hypothetical protein
MLMITSSPAPSLADPNADGHQAVRPRRRQADAVSYHLAVPVAQWHHVAPVGQFWLGNPPTEWLFNFEGFGLERLRVMTRSHFPAPYLILAHHRGGGWRDNGIGSGAPEMTQVVGRRSLRSDATSPKSAVG